MMDRMDVLPEPDLPMSRTFFLAIAYCLYWVYWLSAGRLVTSIIKWFGNPFIVLELLGLERVAWLAFVRRKMTVGNEMMTQVEPLPQMPPPQTPPTDTSSQDSQSKYRDKPPLPPTQRQIRPHPMPANLACLPPVPLFIPNDTIVGQRQSVDSGPPSAPLDMKPTVLANSLPEFKSPKIDDIDNSIENDDILSVTGEFGSPTAKGGLLKILPIVSDMVASYTWKIPNLATCKDEKVVSLPFGPRDWAWQAMYCCSHLVFILGVLALQPASHRVHSSAR